MMQIAANLLESQGGLDGLIAKLQQGGLAEQAASWVGTGHNQAVNGGQLADALGQGTLTQLASQFGISDEQASSGLAQMLPQLIDQLTPNGNTANAGDLLGSVLGSFLNNKT
ncbi:YidB family protein [Uliginosibacterium sp. 31-16]|uniref:YidB family protein n=1 Tax=Uliginosibacterium sp. 31-16 TaxID=3068315 RepID=UPI00353221CD